MCLFRAISYFVSYGWMYLTAPPYALTRLKMNNYPIPTHQINVFNSIPLDLKRNRISISLPAPNPGVLLAVPRSFLRSYDRGQMTFDLTPAG